MQAEWTRLTVTAARDDLDRVTAVMSMIDGGVEIEDYSDLTPNGMYGDLMDEKLLTADKTRVRVSVYVPRERDLDASVAFLKERLSALRVKADISTEGLHEDDWAESWKQYYKPIRLGRVVVVPAWEKYDPAPSEVIITMDPGMAFGTGTHETTRLVLAFLDDLLGGGERVLDLGTGSGILAICASKLGAKTVNAYDIDPVAVRVAADNCRENGCDNITLGTSDLLSSVDLSGGPYDVVCANIVADIILRMARDVRVCVKPGGSLVVSGIVLSRAEDVRCALTENGFSLAGEKTENDWVALRFVRN